jgi:hypothetical protein
MPEINNEHTGSSGNIISLQRTHLQVTDQLKYESIFVGKYLDYEQQSTVMEKGRTELSWIPRSVKFKTDVGICLKILMSKCTWILVCKFDQFST